MITIKKIISVFAFFIAPTIVLATENNFTYKNFTIDLTELNFIYLATTGSVEDSFENETKEIVQFASSYGLNVSKVAIVFVDNGAPAYNNKRNKLDTIKNKEKLVINEDYLIQEYGLPYLKAKRKVLVGVLVFPFVNVQETDKYKIVNFKNTKVSGFSYILPKENSQTKEALVNDYTPAIKTYNRTSALKFLTLKKQQNTLTMFEITDSQNGGVSYLNFPLTKEEVLEMYKKSEIITETSEQN